MVKIEVLIDERDTVVRAQVRIEVAGAEDVI